MMRLHRFMVFCSFLLLASAGCDDPTRVKPVITGEVDLYDELGFLLPWAGQVSVSAITLSSTIPYQTFSDASGWFELEVPDGEAVPLLFSLDGFGDMMRFYLEEGAGPIQVDMFARSSASVTGANATTESCGTVNCLRLALNVDDFFGPGTTRRFFRLYLSTDPGVSANDYQVTDLLVVPNTQPGLARVGSNATFELEGLHGLLGSFTTGTTVHLVIHGATENLANGYLSPYSGLEIFTDLSTIFSRDSFIIP